MKYVWLALWLAAAICGSLSAQTNFRQMRLVSQWSSIDFNFPTERDRQDAIQRGAFVAGNAVPIDVDVHYEGKLKFNC